MSRFLISAVNLECRPGDVSFNLERHAYWLSALADSDIIVFPELSLSGYIKNADELKTLEKDIRNGLESLKALSAQYSGKAVFAGAPLFSGNRIYIAHHYLSSGKLLFSHKKHIPGPSERECFVAAGTPEVFEIVLDGDGGKRRITAGIQLCFETHFPELSIIQQAAGAGLLLMPFASPRETPEEKLQRLKRYLPARAYDNSVYAVCCNQIYPAERTGMSPGCAMIIDPRGSVLAEASGSSESVCSAIIDTERIDRIKNSEMGYFRKYGRGPYGKSDESELMQIDD